MNCPPQTAHPFDGVYLDPAVEAEPQTRYILEKLRGLPVRTLDAGVDPRTLDAAAGTSGGDRFSRAKRQLLLTRRRGAFMKACPGTGGMVCCNYYVVNFATNCPMDCHYCFLQDYLNTPVLAIYTNTSELLAELEAKISASAPRQFRVGTGETADSLALDGMTGFSRLLVPWFARQTNAQLEIKTKSTCIQNLLELDPAGRTVVSWSLSPAEVITRHETGTAGLDERLDAAARCQHAGYGIGFHFDPMIHYAGWQEGYRQVVRALRDRLDPRGVACVSLGSLRYTAGLKKAIGERFPASTLLDAEMFPGADGKFRYQKHLRVEMYRFIVDELRTAWPEIRPYLCMESAEVWKKVFGRQPSCTVQVESSFDCLSTIEPLHKS